MLAETLAAHERARGRRPPAPGHGPVGAQPGPPVRARAVRKQGRGTVARLLAAGLAEFGERGFQAVTVDDIARRAGASHGTFYLYFANKDDFFAVLAQEALAAMEDLADDFPVVTPTGGGRAALCHWVSAFCDTYAAHATVIQILTQRDVAGPAVWRRGLRCLWRLAEAIHTGMTAGMRPADGAGTPGSAAASELSAVACLMMLERVNHLLSSGIDWPRAALIDRLTAVLIAAFRPAPRRQLP
jgi:AcrR family transcriptional regulator